MLHRTARKPPRLPALTYRWLRPGRETMRLVSMRNARDQEITACDTGAIQNALWVLARRPNGSGGGVAVV